MHLVHQLSAVTQKLQWKVELLQGELNTGDGLIKLVGTVPWRNLSLLFLQDAVETSFTKGQ